LPSADATRRARASTLSHQLSVKPSTGPSIGSAGISGLNCSSTTCDSTKPRRSGTSRAIGAWTSRQSCRNCAAEASALRLMTVRFFSAGLGLSPTGTSTCSCVTNMRIWPMIAPPSACQRLPSGDAAARARASRSSNQVCARPSNSSIARTGTSLRVWSPTMVETE
jgi:hypothetical protein